MDLGGLMQQAQKMQREMRQVKDELKKRTVLGESGGGMVKAYVNGSQQLLKVEIDPQVVDADDVEMLEDLVLVAVREGLEKARELSDEAMSRGTGGQVPGLF
ncbi:MAG: YbaB/EbfC family nucleoid-associated protein [Planctomycetota bacterium]